MPSALVKAGMGTRQALTPRHRRLFSHTVRRGADFTHVVVGGGVVGLAIARDVIVKKHGGRIGVESMDDTGTTFVITLPLDPVRCQDAVPA